MGTRSGFFFRAGALWVASAVGVMFAQNASPTPVISFDDALNRARQNAGLIQGAQLLASQAREDTKQARGARLPSLNAFNQFIYTQGNGTPSGVFVANDGVHIYNEQAVVHQELLALFRRGEVNRAAAAAAAAQARVEVARRGLTAIVIQNYYAILAAQRKLENARMALSEAERFVMLTQQQEQGGEAAHADVVRAQVDLEQRRRDVAEASLAIDKAKIALGVLIFPDFSRDFSVVDDLDQRAMLPNSDTTRAQALATNPEVKAATQSLAEAGFDVNIARYQWLPSLGADFFYGIDANQFAARTGYPTQATGRSTLPDYQVPYRQNLGYAAQVTLNIPVWNWGATRSKIKQAEYRREQARLDLSLTRRALDGNIMAAQAEARAAESQLASLQRSVDLATESLRLTLLRYQAGEATALEVVDAQNIANLARNGDDDGLARYQIAVANLKVLLGTL